MKTTLTILSSLLLFATTGKCKSGYIDSASKFDLSPLYVNANKIHQRINYKAGFEFKADIQLRRYLINGKDSAILYDLVFHKVHFKEGVHSVTLNFDQNDQLNQADYSFFEVVKKFQLVPPGDYYTTLQIKPINDTAQISRSFLLSVDSSLSVAAPLRTELNNELISKIQNEGAVNAPANQLVANSQIEQLESHIALGVAKRKGITSVPIAKDGKQYSMLYYKGWFLGSYELSAKQPLLQRLTKERQLFKNNPIALLPNDLNNFTGTNAQTRNLQLNKGSSELSGNIDLSTNLSTDQEPGSQQNNNYQDVYANVGTEIFQIPVVIEGYYTTQDINRKAKASYIRISYDVERSKEELNKTISGYKSQYNATKSKSTGLNTIYAQLITRLMTELAQHNQSIAQEYGISTDVLQLYNGDVDQVVANMNTDALVDKANTDDTSQLAATKAKLIKNKQKIQEQYQKTVVLKQNIDKYQQQLVQYQDHQYFDSALAYNRIEELSNDPNTSYKQLAKAAANILPPGKASSFINGLTKMEIGILNAYESDYTMSGQTLKGGSVGYDIGFATIGAAIGKTEYISRTGSVDQYSSTMLRVDLTPTNNRKIGLVYYTYSPSKQMIQDNNFFKDETGVPSFKSPTHILSIPYAVKINKNLIIEGEGAFSYKSYERKSGINYDNTAFQTNVSYNIPNTSISATAGWEHLGKFFENNALPFPKAATENFQAGTKATFFKSFITAGVQFNYLSQESFSSKGKNIKWGFDVRTHSKRYPNVYVSYKPFSTFRTYDDTLTIQQRPLVGAVWIARASYRIKGLHGAHRIMLTFNNNNSKIDSLSYQSSIYQGAYIYTDRTYIANLNLGWSRQPYYVDGQQIEMAGYFGAVAVSRNLSDQINASFGQDLSFNQQGLQRTATTISGSYQLRKIPIGIRLMLRYSNIKQSVLLSGDKDIWAGQLGCTWRLLPKHKRI